MPAPERSYRRQKALLWEASGVGDDGRATVAGDFDEIDVRWVKKQTQMLDPQNTVVKVDATVVVGEAVPIGSILWEGSAEDLWASLPGTGTGTGTSYVPLSDLFEVVAYRETPDLKARWTRQVVGVNRYRGTMPSFA
jgi:hypothetical protein